MSGRRSRISAIIPVLDEAAILAGQLDDLRARAGLDEVVVVDGGSTDHTLAIAKAARDVRILEAQRGRAPQMNAGAAAASGDILLFLHADVRLPQDAPALIRETLAMAGVVGGAFRTRTVPAPGRNPLGPLLRVADLRAHYTRLPYGDQAIFVRAETFRAVGGFPDQPVMEDLAFSHRLSRLGRIHVLGAHVTVSGRRYQARPLRNILTVNLFPLLYRLGMPAEVLARYYGKVR